MTIQNIDNSGAFTYAVELEEAARGKASGARSVNTSPSTEGPRKQLPGQLVQVIPT